MYFDLFLDQATHSSILAWRIQFHGHRSLEGYSPQGRKESDATERLTVTNTLDQTPHNRCKQHVKIQSFCLHLCPQK